MIQKAAQIVVQPHEEHGFAVRLGTVPWLIRITQMVAMQANATEMDKVVAAIRAAGIAERDIQTSGVNLNPDYRYNDNQPPTITGGEQPETPPGLRGQPPQHVLVLQAAAGAKHQHPAEEGVQPAEEQPAADACT